MALFLNLLVCPGLAGEKHGARTAAPHRNRKMAFGTDPAGSLSGGSRPAIHRDGRRADALRAACQGDGFVCICPGFSIFSGSPMASTATRTPGMLLTLFLNCSGSALRWWIGIAVPGLNADAAGMQEVTDAVARGVDFFGGVSRRRIVGRHGGNAHIAADNGFPRGDDRDP